MQTETFEHTFRRDEGLRWSRGEHARQERAKKIPPGRESRREVSVERAS